MCGVSTTLVAWSLSNYPPFEMLRWVTVETDLPFRVSSGRSISLPHGISDSWPDSASSLTPRPFAFASTS